MDFNSLKDQVSNLTLYDLKAGVRKVQNGKVHLSQAIVGYQLGTELTRDPAVMNYTEMESKVFTSFAIPEDVFLRVT